MSPAEFVFTVTEAEGNLILAALQELPFKHSHAIIMKLKAQADEQVAPKTAENPQPFNVSDPTAE